MKHPSPKMQAQLVVFQVEQARKKAVVEAIWTRDGGKCKYCQKSVTPAAYRSPSPGYIRWADPAVITVDGGALVCRAHYVPQMVTK